MRFGSRLSTDLQGKHAKKSVRPRVGDSARIVRGEFKGIEGKITDVDSAKGVLMVEGVTREKLKGGSSPVPIRSSNVIITTLALEDKIRRQKLEGTA